MSENIENTTQKQEPLRSVHTTNFPAILEQLGISLVVSTYQAGRLVLLRAEEDKINTHFRMFNRPMGVAADRERITVGTAAQIWYLRNIPAVSQKLTPPNKHDACYLPRSIHVTGDIDIHEMAWGDELPPPHPSPKGRGSRASAPTGGIEGGLNGEGWARCCGLSIPNFPVSVRLSINIVLYRAGGLPL